MLKVFPIRLLPALGIRPQRHVDQRGTSRIAGGECSRCQLTRVIRFRRRFADRTTSRWLVRVPTGLLFSCISHVSSLHINTTVTLCLAMSSSLSFLSSVVFPSPPSARILGTTFPRLPPGCRQTGGPISIGAVCKTPGKSCFLGGLASSRNGPPPTSYLSLSHFPPSPSRISSIQSSRASLA